MGKTNRLGSETSPYLLQHKDNPVHWHPWGDNALNEARNQGKPILLSIGYAACHWCHVMAHESFENPQIAKLMNELFVNIKVDREERPDIDGVYMTALGLMGEQGGWPLTMFLTPDGEPFWGGTYFPPEARYGRPGFSDILLKVADIFHTQPDNIRQNADAIIESLKKSKATATDIQINGEVLDRVTQLLYQQIDVVHGGLGRAPKFPQCNALEMILRTWLRHRDGAMLGAVNKSLSAMCQGGIYDHLGGGFARYSTDAQWLAPHFEKMLYDNAQLIDILTLAWQVGGNPLYAIRIEETIAWILREMVVDGGGFAATLDADSEGEEGKFYVWQEAEIDKVLGDNATDFKAAYDVSPSGNWEGKVILNRSAKSLMGDPDHELLLLQCRTMLLKQRNRRTRPSWDDKVLADWNGLMIAAIANTAVVFERPDWGQVAVAAYNFVLDRMCPNGQLVHAYRNGQAKHRAVLDDFANMTRAALTLYEIHGEYDYMQQAIKWVEDVEVNFNDPANGGYYFSSAEATDIIARLRICQDAAVPSGNGVMIGNLTRLWLLTGADIYRQRAHSVVQAFSSQLNEYSLGMTTFLNNAEFFGRPLQIVIIGEVEAERTKALVRAVYSSAIPNKILTVLPPGQELPPDHPAANRVKIEGQASAYVCIDQTCSLPQTTAPGLREALELASGPDPETQ